MRNSGPGFTGPPREHTAEITPRHDHKVRVESLFGIHRRPELSDHLLNRDTAAAGAGFRRKRLVFNVGASDARLNVFPHGVMRTDGITVACVGIREDGDLHGQDNFPGRPAATNNLGALFETPGLVEAIC